MASLAEHFGMEDQLLKQQIEKAVHECVLLKNALSSLALPSKLAFYPELREEYDKAAIHLNQEKEAFLSGITTITASFNKKLGLRSTSYSEDISVDTAVYVLALETISAIIKRHNDKTASFEREKSQAREALEAHYLSTIVDSVTEIDRQITELNERISQLRDGSDELEDKRGIQELSETIAQKQSQVSSAHAAGADLTEHLTRFLGRTDLKFDSTPEGYKVLRRGKLAKRLSEGEKTAIAFIYFLVQLKDQDFDLAEGVVVIDDPISSLDSSAIYQAFAFLKNGVKDAKQVFIFTHNFDFLKLLINWLRAGKRGDRSYYMVLCAESQAGRNARLERLDNLLVDHPTEYHYLFKVLHNFKSDGTILNAYHIPNIARKVLETFLDFHVPSDLSLYDKLEAINFDQHKKTAIYKFSNDLSHRTGKGFDPALVAETQKNTAHLLEMIKDIAPAHYNGLEKLSA
jgi:wobble nucleotide-excising tRNase